MQAIRYRVPPTRPLRRTPAQKSRSDSIRVAVVARSVAPLHGLGGLERSVFDLVRYLAAHDVHVTLITRPPRHSASISRIDAPALIHPRVSMVFVPYRTFPLAGRRGTTVIDRSTAYPVFGMRAGQAALQLVR